MEIRVHGRGGQGGVTCAKILASAYAQLGKNVQAFGDYAGERSGAPVRAYARVSDDPILNRNKVYEPDHLLVLDPTLLDGSVLSGLRVGGTLLINSPDHPDLFARHFPGVRLATVDATRIAREHGIGTRTLVIVNTTIAGAYARVLGLDLDALLSAYEHMGLSGNAAAAREAFEKVKVREVPEGETREAGEGGAAALSWGASAAGPVKELVEHTEGVKPVLKTGSWRSSTPRFTHRIAPCSDACPAGNDVVGFAQALARTGEEAAADVLGRTTPLAATAGRVCEGFCMKGCNRVNFDGAVDTKGLERWIADNVPVARPGKHTTDNPRRVAIVGGGPAGLSAAYHLARLGHKPTIYDLEPELGGLLRTGIPSYRLPREVLDREVANILQMGVQVRLGVRLSPSDVEQLSAEYDAVVLATGMQKMTGLAIEGADLDCVEQGLVFLHRRNSGEQKEIQGHVVILGGGNTAIDCARSALRSGASKVTVAYRRTRIEMPAIFDEVTEAMDEDVRFLFQRAPVAIFGNPEGRVEGIELAEVQMGPADESGRRRPVVTDKTELYSCDAVLLALGQSPDLSLLPQGWQLASDGRAWLDGQPLNVFAAGDVTTWDGTVPHAIGHGRNVVNTVLVSLEAGDRGEAPPARPGVIQLKEVRFEHFDSVAPTRHRHMAPTERIKVMDEVNFGLPDPGEAKRCLSCGLCSNCDTCLVYCPEGCVHRDAKGGYEFDYDTCKGCGICAVECPRGCIEMIMA